METKETLLHQLDCSRAKMLAQLEKIDLKREIYPLWTIREMLAHLSGWDDAVIAFIQSVMAGREPATPAARGIDYYNAQTVATREGLDYDHIYREYIATREQMLKLLRQLPEEKIYEEFILPWGERGTVVDIIHIFAPHEEEHAEDVEKIISAAGTQKLAE
jgi:hypothetical protein